MPLTRSPKKTWGQPAGQPNKFVPARESLAEEVDEDYRVQAESDPYNRYFLKTGKYRGHTLRYINDQGDIGYLRWMLTNAKACRDVDDEHIVRKGLLDWKSQTEGQGAVSASASGTASTSRSTAGLSEAPSASGSQPADPKTARFKDAHERPIWITGADIIGLFHMSEKQLKRAGVRAMSSRFDKQYRTNTYRLQQVYDAAACTPKCPIDEKPDQALDRYLAKVQKCGGGVIAALPHYCDCNDCENIRCGPTPGGSCFWMKMLQLRLKERQREQEREEEKWAGFEPWMGDYD